MRLTQKDDQGNWCLKGVRWEQLHTGSVITWEVREKLYAALWKLMEYEDTGFSPAQIHEMCDLYGEKCAELAEERQRKIPMKPKYEIRTSVIHKSFVDGTELLEQEG